MATIKAHTTEIEVYSYDASGRADEGVAVIVRTSTGHSLEANLSVAGAKRLVSKLQEEIDLCEAPPDDEDDEDPRPVTGDDY